MKISEIIEICEKAIPREVEYEVGEPYGPYNIPDLNMDVRKILYCVTPSPAIRKYFKENGYDLLISHHPYIAGKDVPQLIYHTALDCCEGGLNDQWADAIGINKETRQHFDKDLGWYGKLNTPRSFTDLIERVEWFCDIDGQIYSEGNGLIETVVVCSGLGGLVNEEALSSGADCYILGQATMPATEMGFKAVIEVGHTNSEQMCGYDFFYYLFEDKDVRIDFAPKTIDVFGTEYYRNK